MSLRVLHILDHSLPLHSGYVFRTQAILRGQRALGWETLQLTTPRHGPCRSEQEALDGWLFHRTAPPPQRAALPGVRYLPEMHATAARIEELVRRWRPDVLHAHSPVLSVLPALWVGRKRGLPVVYEVRASWEDAAVDHGSTAQDSLRYRLSRRLETFAVCHADHVTTICAGLEQDLVARGLAPDRVTVVPNAVDIEAFRGGGAPDAALADELGLRGATVLGFAGSFYRYEGLDLLLEAARLLRSRWPDLKLLLLGGGPQEDALRAQAQVLGMEDCVLLPGRVPHERVAAYYDLIDVLVYPRRSMRLTELVTPLKPLEAMAQGRVLIASDVGGHRELIRDGETGHLFEAGNITSLTLAIERVLRQRERWPVWRAQARGFVERHRTWPKSVARYAEVYASALARRGRGAGPARRPGLQPSPERTASVRDLRHR